MTTNNLVKFIILGLAFYSCFAVNETQAEPLPAADPAVYDDHSPKQLLELSFVGIGRKSIRGYLAMHRGDTVEGLFCKAWVLSESEQYQQAATAYSKVIEDSRAWPVMRSIAAANAAHAAIKGDLPTKEKRALDAYRIAYETGSLNNLSFLSYDKEYRERHLELQDKYSDLLKKYRAAYLVSEARYHSYVLKDYRKTRELIEELWDMDMDQWKGDFNFSLLLSLKLNEKVYPDTKPAERLTSGGFMEKLMRYRIKVDREERDPLRRAIVSNWCTEYSGKIDGLDRRHHSHSLAAFRFLHTSGTEGSMGLYPTGNSLSTMMKLWDYPRDGTQLANRGEQPKYTLADLAELSSKKPPVPEAEWHLNRGKLLSRLGRWSEADHMFREAARTAFYPAARVEVLYQWAIYVLNPQKHDSAEARRQLVELLDLGIPDVNRRATQYLSYLAYASGDMPSARKWAEEMGSVEDTSKSFIKSMIDGIKSIEDLQKEKKRYDAANPLESKWLSQFGRKGVSVQLNFDTASSQLPANAEEKLSPILRILEDETYSNLVFRVEGHTDITGTDATNGPLSLRRAQSVADYLIRRKGIARTRIEIDSYGSKRPIASNLSESGRALNRRAELNLIGDVTRPKLVATGSLSNEIANVSPDGRLLIAGNGDVWDTSSWVRLYTAPSQDGYFSPDGRYLLVVQPEYEGTLIPIGLLLDARTGVFIQNIPNMGTGRFNPVWSPNSKKIAYTSGDYCHIYDLETNTFDGSAAIPGGGGSALIAWVKGGTHLAVCHQTGSGNLYMVHAETFNVETMEVPELNYVHAMASSLDARYLYISNDKGYIVDWDTIGAGRPQLQRFWVDALKKGVRFAAKQISINPENPHLVALNCMHSRTWGVVDFKTGEIRSDKSDAFSLVFWGKDARELLLWGDWVANSDAKQANAETESGIYRLNLRNGESIKNDNLEFIKGESARLWLKYAFEKLNLLAVMTVSDVTVWDVQTGRQIHRWADGLEYVHAATKDAPGVFYGILENKKEKESALVRYDLNDFSRNELMALEDFKVTAMDVGSKVLVIGGRPFMERNSGTEEVIIKVVDVKSGKILKGKTVPTATEPLVYGHIGYSGFQNLKLSPSGDEVAFVTKWADGYIGHGKKASKRVGRWHWKSDTIKKPVEISRSVESFSYESEKLLRVSSSQYYKDALFDLEAEKWDEPLSRKSRPNRYCNTPIDSAFEDKNLKIETSSRGEIRFIRRDTDEVAVTILKKRGEWFAYNPEGYYATSSKGTDKVFWRVGTRMLPLESLREKFENPALIADSLKAVFSKRVVKKADIARPKIDPDLFSIPYEMNVLSETGVETKSDSYTMKVEIKTLTGDAPKPDIVWTINGHRGRGFKIVPAKVDPQRYVVEHDFKLSEGSNVFSAAIRYKGAVVMPKTVSVNKVVNRSTPGAEAGKTHLWFFGVGVKNYERADQNLEYADRDAVELAKMFEAQKGKLFKDVHTKVVINEQATVRDIKIEMNRFLKQASSEDVIVIFLAGHGVVSTDQELYFMAHDSDIKEIYTGLELRDFSEFLERRPPNQKAIFMMDICHAGSFGQTSKRRGSGLTSEDAIKLIERGTGTVVLASSTGRESSLEDEAFRGGHGAFTAALLVGLEGAADGNGNGDGYIFISELTSYVSREVPRLTKGAQHPTTPRMENLLDFPIGKGN